LSELEASSIPLRFPLHATPAELLADWQNADRQAGQGGSDLAEENELLLLQLHQVQEELESHFLANRSLERKLRGQEKLSQQSVGLQQELLSIHQELVTSRAEVNALRESLSWRLTAPLRKILDVFGGRRG
jgi:hypothetical protein